ncbi:MAG: NAD(P)H-hydrate dehydratase [Candidatus Omnitrophica bacterium]|jgi:NAD(P)H-hydrate epimerase|nr:NAD(P)H-hydrate dehydratase [Candidatus Omnitrophota bacterium]
MKLPKQLIKRKLDTYKGDYGYVFVLGGSPGLTGAVSLCANAALRMGAGLVRAAVPASLGNILSTKLTEATSLFLNEENGYLSEKGFQQITDLLERIDVVALGGGASQAPCAQKLLLKVIKNVDKPMVIDADALNAISTVLTVLKERKSKNIVLTPHLAEFSRLTGLTLKAIKAKRKELVKEFAFKYNLTLILKGNRTLVSNGKTLFENNTGNPGMATAGCGDVLTGIIVGLMAQGIDVLTAAKFGVYIHGLAGDLAAKDKTETCLIASDIIEYLPKAVKRLATRNT